jgi:hypothetical protein
MKKYSGFGFYRIFYHPTAARASGRPFPTLVAPASLPVDQEPQ